jgi:RNA polymerase sigma factor (sigma-70 family)
VSPSENRRLRESAELAGSLFRHEGARLVAVMTKIFGIQRLELAEDVVQEALAKALQTWPYYGVPKNPAAWLTQTAKNLVLDRLRREKRFGEKQAELTAAVELWSPSPEETIGEEIQDDRLRLMFACCHPLIPVESQTALALKTLCGFSPAEIAHAFLTTEAAVAKRLTRARQKLRESLITLEIPTGDELGERLDTVLQALYLLFNEGYKASHGDKLVRAELCREAVRLTTLLLEHPVGQVPRVHALLALMWLNSARLPARVDHDGHLMRLEEQERSLWDQAMIARGVWHLQQSAAGTDLSSYHLQAAIAAHHCTAASFEATDWKAILQLYDRLGQLEPTPVVALNRAVALAQVEGVAAGKRAVEQIRQAGGLTSYHLLYAVLADFEFRLGNLPAAARHLREALQLTQVESEKELLESKLRDCLQSS